jgi:hypothetical protein
MQHKPGHRGDKGIPVGALSAAAGGPVSRVTVDVGGGEEAGGQPLLPQHHRLMALLRVTAVRATEKRSRHDISVFLSIAPVNCIVNRHSATISAPWASSVSPQYEPLTRNETTSVCVVTRE